MRNGYVALAALALVLSTTAAGRPAAANVDILYQAVDLPDGTSGQDLYQYNYSLSEFSHPSGYGFTVLFDPTLYGSLSISPPAVGPDWDVISIQPDPLIPDVGAYDALSLVGSPTTLTGFSIDFAWLGTGTPGSQPFVIYDDQFATVQIGDTITQIPEPGTGILFGFGLTCLAGARMRSRERVS